MIQALTILLLFELIGELIARLGSLPVPGPVIGMLGLSVLLLLRGRVPEHLARVASTILQHLSLLFVPAGVGVILHLSRIRAEWEAIVVALLGSTVLTLIVTVGVFGLCVRLVARKTEREP